MSKTNRSSLVMDEVFGTLERRATVGTLRLVFDTAAVRPKVLIASCPVYDKPCEALAKVLRKP